MRPAFQALQRPSFAPADGVRRPVGVREARQLRGVQAPCRRDAAAAHRCQPVAAAAPPDRCIGFGLGFKSDFECNVHGQAM